MNIVSQTVPFDPSKLNHLQIWVMADKITQPIGSQVNILKDYSIFGNDMRVTTTGPTKVPNVKVVRGCTRPCLDMSVGTMFTHTSIRSLPRVRPNTVCMAFIPTSVSSLNFLSTVAGGFQVNFTSNSQISLIQQSVSLLVTINMSTILLANKMYVLTLTLSGGGTFSVYLNGVFQGSGTSNTALTAGTFSLGSNDWGYLFELMFFDDILPRGETEKIEQYLNRKYGAF